MKCSKCLFENPDATNYCGKCGVPLTADARMADSLTKTLATPLPAISKDNLIAGKYRIVEEVGAGGMGIVYKAEDLKLKRSVALKFLPPHLMDAPDLKERFLIEAQAAAALSHPNICVIYEVGESDERPYIAMEFVEGETLRERVRKGLLKTEEAVDIVSQVAAGLGEAHGKGIIHRDIKSANIMVTEKGQAKVMDFGLAKLRGGSSLTKSQTTLGTVAYMSPEQARGEELDRRTDLWSLGVVLYEMVSGELPLKGDRELSIIHSIIHEEPKPLSARKPPIPPEIRQIIGRALRKNRDARYASADEMLKDLRAFQESLHLEASGVLSVKTLGRQLRKPRIAVPAAAVLAGLAFLGYRFFKHQADVRWVRELAYPEIERLATDIWGDFPDSRVRARTKIEAQRVGKYMVRPILALDRLLFLEREGQVGYRHGPNADEFERMDYLEFIARVTSHIPDKGQVMVRYYGLYANAHRGKVRKANRVPVALGMIEEEPRPVPSKGWAALIRKPHRGLRSAEMIRKIYEVDPLICPRCGGRMKVVAFLTEYAVVDRIIRHLTLTFAAEKPPPAHVFEQVALLAALMEAMRTARLPLRPVLMRHHECGRGERGVRIATDLEREGGV